METIEERAEIIYQGNTIEEDAYKRGAEEQKQIDRIHFKKWYCKKICYKRNKCQHPSVMCYRLGKIGKEVFGYENN